MTQNLESVYQSTATQSRPAAVSIIVPTLRRPDYLRLCLSSIAAQTVRPEQVLIGIRPDDRESVVVVNAFLDEIPVQVIEAGGVGVIGSMSSCLKQASEDFIALVDDDVELPPHWLRAMLGHLARNSGVLGAAGRDFLQDHPDMRRKERLVNDVGRVHWYGRITGNHHRGAGEPRLVDILRGSNCLFRGDFLRDVGFELKLRGMGAQVNWELALAFHAMRRGKSLFYDPTIEVIHHTAPRLDYDQLHRGTFVHRATCDSAFNETFVTLRHAPHIRRWAAIVYQCAVGSSMAPGVFHFCRQITTLDIRAIARLIATAEGRLAAIWQSVKAD